MQKVVVYRQKTGKHVACRYANGQVTMKMGEPIFTVEAETAEAVSIAAREEAARLGITKVLGLGAVGGV